MAASSQPSHGGINNRAASGFAKSADYDKHRPSYSSTAIQELLKQLRVTGKKHAKVLDLAAGTGKATEILARRDEQYEIFAVEPHDEMRAVMAAKDLPNVTIMSGTADKIPLDDESIDAVVVAQAFHWFANMDALREIHRVLRPHGCLGMMWNIEHYNHVEDHQAATMWEAKAHQLTWTFNDNEPRFRHNKWRKVFEDQTRSSPLALLIASEQLFALPLGEHIEPFEVWLPKDQIWERYNTISHISVLQGEERERTHKTFMDALHDPDVAMNDNGEVAIHGDTFVVWTSKIPEDGREELTSVERPGS